MNRERLDRKRLDRVSSRWLRLFPRRFRDRHEEDLAELYRDLYWRPGAWARLRFGVRVALDAVFCGLAARWDAFREPRPFKSRRQQGEGREALP